jgi:hypothetical protein
MSGCCNEYGCKRKHPYAVYFGLLSNRVYLAGRSTDLGNGISRVDGPKHDITPTIEQFILQNRDWVMSVLGYEKEQEDDSI